MSATWSPDGAGTSLKEAVFQALGTASVCWENMSGTGVFDSDQANAVGNGLLKWLSEVYGVTDIAQRTGHWVDPGISDVGDLYLSVSCYALGEKCRLWTPSGMDEFAADGQPECEVVEWFLEQQPTPMASFYVGLGGDLTPGEIEVEWDNHTNSGDGGYLWKFKGEDDGQ